MTKVADKTLAQYVKFQHDMLERVLKGSVDPIALMNAQRPLIGQKANPYLRLISGGETVTISACKGGKNANIYHAKKTFPGYIDPDFNNYGINLPQPTTEKIDVDVYEMYNKDADFRTLFGSLGSDLKSCAFESQEQIETFCQENKQWLRTGGYGTFFLFTEKVNGEEKFFVAGVYFRSGELGVVVRHLSDDNVENASGAHRIVVPATKTSDTQS
ncbi:hypothetical protein H6776_02170 [Candidatus Nomurabacteria bacterium]|nr:hypothetical protein [Candidatus Nomurabacteria bacterium]